MKRLYLNSKPYSGRVYFRTGTGQLYGFAHTRTCLTLKPLLYYNGETASLPEYASLDDRYANGRFTAFTELNRNHTKDNS